YCKAALEHFKRTGQKEPDEVRITHNIFVKDTGQVLSRSVSVSVALIEEAWNQAIKIVRRQRELHKLTRDQYIEAPVCEDQKSCHKYGGCEYLRICWGGVSIEEFCRQPSIVGAFWRPSDMNFEDFLKSETSGTKAGVAEEPVPVNGPNPAPWGRHECKACKGTGLASNGSPCHPCRLAWEDKGHPPVSEFEKTPTGNWVLKSDDDAPSEGSEEPQGTPVQGTPVQPQSEGSAMNSPFQGFSSPAPAQADR